MNAGREPLAGFEFASAGRIIFGAGVARKLGAEAKRFGQRALLVTGRDAARARFAEVVLRDAGLEFERVSVGGEPRVEDALQAVQVAARGAVELVVAFGGGSAIDLGKAAAALLANPGDPYDFLEVVGRGQALRQPALPVIAVPTTAGTGAEVTKNAVLSATEPRVKASLRHESMLPRLSLVDPELTLSLPAQVTAATGLDALTQCLEPFVSAQANPLTDAISLEGLRRGARALRTAFHDGLALWAREDMALCSLFGGLSLANAKLGAVHGFAAPIGGRFSAPHGAVCARLLPFVLEENERALRERAPGSARLGRLDVVAQVLTGEPEARARDGAAWLQSLADDLQIPGLARYGMTREDVTAVAESAAKASSMKGNPIELTHAELERILLRAL